MAQAVREAEERLPLGLQKGEQVDRLGRALSAVLMKAGEGGLLGEMRLHETSHRPEDAWLLRERQANALLAAMMENEA